MISPFSSVAEIAEAIRRREVSPVEVTEMFLRRIDAYNPALNAIVWIDGDASLAEARQAEERVMSGRLRGPIDGVPFPVKDLSMAAGQPCFFGSLGTDTRVQAEDDPAVALLRGAGGTLLGRSHAPEAGTMTVSETQRFGVARNPWNLDHSPGGSSGGAAAVVAAGLAPFAHASDGGGSIRVPASSCAVVGLKPSRGRVPTRLIGWEHAATEGAEARTVRDSALLLDILSAFEPRAMYNAPRQVRPFAEEVDVTPPRLRIALMTDAPGGLPVDPQVLAAARAAARLLEELGHDIVEVPVHTYSQAAVEGYITHIMDASVAVGPYEHPELAEPYLQVRRERALSATAVDYLTSALRIQDESWHVAAQFGRDFDVVLSPTMARLPAPAGELVAEANAQPHQMRLREAQMVAFTSWVNLAGLPAISLPLALSTEGLPIGVQLVGGPWGESLLIALAATIERATPWSGRVPPAYRDAP